MNIVPTLPNSKAFWAFTLYIFFCLYSIAASPLPFLESLTIPHVWDSFVHYAAPNIVLPFILGRLFKNRWMALALPVGSLLTLVVFQLTVIPGGLDSLSYDMGWPWFFYARVLMWASMIVAFLAGVYFEIASTKKLEGDR